LVDRAQQHIYRAFLFTYLCCDLSALMRGIIPTSYVSFEKGEGFVELFGHGSPPKQRKWDGSIIFNATAPILSR
jgi:hypothetical protein